MFTPIEYLLCCPVFCPQIVGICWPVLDWKITIVKNTYKNSSEQIHTDTVNESKQTPPFNSSVFPVPCKVKDSKSKRNQQTSEKYFYIYKDTR